MMSACLVAVDIAQGDENSAGEFRIVRQELADQGVRDAVPAARISGPPPRPGAVTTSATPSPVTSPTATRTPPRKGGSVGRE